MHLAHAPPRSRQSPRRRGHLPFVGMTITGTRRRHSPPRVIPHRRISRHPPRIRPSSPRPPLKESPGALRPGAARKAAGATLVTGLVVEYEPPALGGRGRAGKPRHPGNPGCRAKTADHGGNGSGQFPHCRPRDRTTGAIPRKGGRSSRPRRGPAFALPQLPPPGSHHRRNATPPPRHDAAGRGQRHVERDAAPGNGGSPESNTAAGRAQCSFEA